MYQKAIAILAGVYASRMLGMFMIFPVFSLYAQSLSGSNAYLIGVALGIYGLTQGLLQIPFGYLSDKFGRKLLMIVGLILFVSGSLLAAIADNIYFMIFARAVQGMGAISAVSMAYAADIAPRDKLDKVMAILGATIGISFVLSLIIGPVLANLIGFKGIFYFLALLAFVALLAVIFLPNIANQAQSEKQGKIDKKSLFKASLSIFLLHGVFSAIFLVLPIYLRKNGLDSNHHWWLYLPANLIAIAFMRFKNGAHPLFFGLNFLILALSLIMLFLGANFWWLMLSLSVFFVGFYRLETALPHWVAQIADLSVRGRAMGIFSTSQFGGSFFGATFAGWLMRNSLISNFGEGDIFVLFALISGLIGMLLFYWAKKPV